MRLSVFTTVTRPEKRGDNAAVSLACYKDLSDEMVEINGSHTDYGVYTTFVDEKPHHRTIYHEWPQEFSWEFIGEQFQRGYEEAAGDWVIHADLDFIFHENDFGKIRQALKDYPNAPAVSFYKWQFILPDRYNLKSRLVLAVNKGRFGDRIRFNGGGDLCQPTLDGKELDINEVPQAGVPFYNYEKLTKTKDQIIDDVERMERAYNRYFKAPLYTRHDKHPFDGWMKMMKGRFEKPSARIALEQHPKYIQDTIRNLKPEQFGYSGFGELEVNSYAKGML